jgi:uncharacterized membrane protein YqgA involved in biofilm formation
MFGFGTILNAAAILIGGLIGLWRPGLVKPQWERRIQVLLGAFTVFYGLRLVVMSLHPPFTHILKGLGIVLLSLMVGRLLGGLFRLQKLSNRIGQQARETLTVYSKEKGPAAVGFKMCGALYCAAPLAVIGAVCDGLSGYFSPLAVKAIMDGLATMGFAVTFRWGPLLSALPVLAFQGSVALLARLIAQHLGPGEAIDMMNAVSGFLVFTVALVILQIKRIGLADYLPCLVVAPLLGRVFS